MCTKFIIIIRIVFVHIVLKLAPIYRAIQLLEFEKNVFDEQKS